MALSTLEQQYTDYLRNSLVLKSPDVETDPAFKFTDEDLLYILEIGAGQFNPKIPMTEFPDGDMAFVFLLARKEVYWRLANATAPFYPLEAEGASLKKNVRFDHYMALLKYTDESYDKMLKAREEAENQLGNGMFSVEVYTSNRYYTHRNKTGIQATIEVKVMDVGEEHIDISWTVPPTGDLYQYLIYVDEKLVYDPYEDQTIRSDAKPVFDSFDRLRTKYRKKGLLPGKTYYVCVVAKMRNGQRAIAQVPAVTKSVVVPEGDVTA